jgi:DNA gyrase subunit A
MIINKSGLTIRMAIEDLRVMGRATQGVKLINLKGNDSIAAVTKVMKDDVEEVIVDEDGNIIKVETIERVKPVLEILEDEGGEDEDEDEDDSEVEDDTDEEDSEEDDQDDEA